MANIQTFLTTWHFSPISHVTQAAIITQLQHKKFSSLSLDVFPPRNKTAIQNKFWTKSVNIATLVQQRTRNLLWCRSTMDSLPVIEIGKWKESVTTQLCNIFYWVFKCFCYLYKFHSSNHYFYKIISFSKKKKKTFLQYLYQYENLQIFIILFKQS